MPAGGGRSEEGGWYHFLTPFTTPQTREGVLAMPSHTLRAGSPCLQSQLTVLPRRGAGPVLPSAVAGEGLSQVSHLLQPVRVWSGLPPSAAGEAARGRHLSLTHATT